MSNRQFILPMRDAADLTRKQRTANPEAADALAIARARAPEPPWPSLTVRLGAAIEEALARGVPAERESLARSLGMSGKTLARRLRDEQRRFRDVDDEVRRLRAQQLVEEGTVDLTEVAACVGFADLAAFGEAFQRWFGASPSAVRARRRRGERAWLPPRRVRYGTAVAAPSIHSSTMVLKPPRNMRLPSNGMSDGGISMRGSAITFFSTWSRWRRER